MESKVSFSWKFVLFLVLLYGLFSHYYFMERYGGNWLAWDASYSFKATEFMYLSKKIPTGVYGTVYPNGFGLQLFSVLLSHIAGMDLIYMYNVFYPLTGSIVVLVFFVLVKELFNDDAVALLSSILLSIQPDFLFITSRSTHERFFIISFLLMLLCLKRSFSVVSTKEFRIYVLLAYVFMFEMLAFNIFFSSSMLMAILLSMIMGLLAYEFRLFKTSFIRLIYISCICMVITFYFMFFVYTPAKIYLRNISRLIDQAGLMFFGLEDTAISFEEKFPQYVYVLHSYRDPRLFLILRLFDFVIFPLGFISAVINLRRLYKDHKRTDEHIIFLLFVYLGFLMQFVFSIFFDRIGLLAKNVELRIFPYIHMLAIPLAAYLIVDETRGYGKYWKSTIYSVLVVFILLSAALSLLKATNEPSISKKWVYYSDDELRMMKWIAKNPHKQFLYGGYDHRLILLAYSNLNYSDYRPLTLGSSRAGVIIPTSDLEGEIMADYNMTASDFYLQLVGIQNILNEDVVYDSGSSKVYLVY